MPVYHEPALGGPQYRYHPPRLPPAHAAAYQPIPSLLSLPPHLLRSFQHTYMRAIHHHNWLTLLTTAHLSRDLLYAANLIDTSQVGACDFLRATPSSPATSIPSAVLRIRLLRQLRLPFHTSDEDPFADQLINENGPTHRHTEALNSLEQLATRAHGSNTVLREPVDHYDTCPGYKPDLLTLAGGDKGRDRADDLKIGATYSKNMTPQHLEWASQVAFSEVAYRFTVKVRGREQVGHPGEPRFNPITGYGFRKAKVTCDYAEVLAQQTTVGVLAFNVYGGRSDETQRWWKRQIRLTGNALSADEAAISPTAVRLNSYISQRISCGIVKTTGQQVQRGQRAAQRDYQAHLPRGRRGRRSQRRATTTLATDTCPVVPCDLSQSPPSATHSPRHARRHCH